MNWKPEVKVDGKWHQNGLVFATMQEALDNARDLRSRWILVTDHGARESEDPVNYEWLGSELRPVSNKAGGEE